ncbi:hypothetical protein HDV63DRAFT_364342 [Trichoderma sp. SZMC 28014]
MAKDDAQLDVLRSTEATPIAKLSPAILDAEALVIEGVITVTWPYSAVAKSIAFILAERDPLHRRDKGQLRVEFQGAAAKALADAHLGGGDEVRLSLDGVRWEENQAWMRRPGTLEWQMKFTNRLLLMIRRAESHDVDTISVDVDDNEGGQESIEQPQTMSSSPTIEIEQTHFANPMPRTPLPVVPSKRHAYETLGPGEYTSPAFIKRARVSYGSLFEGGFDIFDEEEPPRSAKKKKRRSLFNMNPTSWRYASRSPSPEVEEQSTGDEEEPTLANTETVTVEGGKEPEKRDQLPAAQPQPLMVDHGCQTREMSSSPVSGVQIIAESKSTGILLQPTPTNPWKNPDMGHVLQQPSPLSFEYATAHDARPRVQDPEPIRQPEIHALPSGFDMSTSIDPSLQSHEADVHDDQQSYDMMAAEMRPPPPREDEAHSPQTHDGLAWVADTLAQAYPTMPTHDAHAFPQGSLARSSYTLRASPSDETHTLESAGYHGLGMHDYVRVNEAHAMLSSSFTQSDIARPNHKYHERREDDTETATVTATFGREGRSSPPQVDSSTDESQEEEEEEHQRGYYDWNRQDGDPEEAYDDDQHAEQDHGGEDDITESELEESGSDADYESGSEYENESETRNHNEIAQPAFQIPRPFHIPRPFIPIPRPAPAAPKEPVVISLLSDSEDDDSDKPTTVVQTKKEPSEEPIQPEKYEVKEQRSEQEDEDMDEDEDEDEDEDQDGYEDEDEVEIEDGVEDEDGDTDDYVDDGLDVDESMDEIEAESDIAQAAEIKPAVSQSSKRSSMASQFDGDNAVALLQHDEPGRNEIGQFEMDHPNLILSPKPDRRQYVNIAETIAETQNTIPIVSSPLADRIMPQPESVIANADNEELSTNRGVRGISKSPSPEPMSIETPAVPEEAEEAPIAQQQPEGEQEQEQIDEQEAEEEQEQPDVVSSKPMNSGEPAIKPSVHSLDIPADLAETEEIPILQSTTNDDQLMEDIEPAGLEIQPANLESKTEDTVYGLDMDMQGDVLKQLREEAEDVENVENVLEREMDRATGEVSPKTTGELKVVASSPLPATLTALSSLTSTAVPALDEQAVTKELSIPLEAQQDDHEVYQDVADTVVTEEVPLTVDESAQAVDEDVEEPVYHDVEEDLEEDAEEDTEESTEEDMEEDVEENVSEYVEEDAEEDEYEDAREDGGDDNDNDDDTAIEQQLMAESQLYSTPQKTHDSPALSQPLEAVEEIHECNHAHHDHHHHAHHHHDHHTEQSAHERGSRRAEPEMLITVQSLRSHCRAKRVSSGSFESFLTDPNTSFTKGSPNKASQCLIGDEESLPQRSPRSSRSSPRSKAEHSEGSAALAKSPFQESRSPKETGAPTSLRARRGVKGPTDASILLAQALSEPSERSPQQLNSPAESLRASHKSNQPDPSSQLTADSSKSSQQQLEEETPQDAAHDASATPRRDATPESTATGHNLRSPRKPAASRPSSATSSVAEDVSITSLKIQLTKSLRTSLPDYLSLNTLRASLNKTADILAVVTATPREPHRPKSGPRDYMLEFNLTDPSAAPSKVIIAHIFRPHKFTLPAVQAGDIVLLRRVQVVSMQGRGFGVRAGDASAWAVYEKDSQEMLPQIKGPPVEITNEEFEYVQGLKRWWSLQDDKSLAKIDKANQRMSQSGKDDAK